MLLANPSTSIEREIAIYREPNVMKPLNAISAVSLVNTVGIF